MAKPLIEPGTTVRMPRNFRVKAHRGRYGRVYRNDGRQPDGSQLLRIAWEGDSINDTLYLLKSSEIPRQCFRRFRLVQKGEECTIPDNYPSPPHRGLRAVVISAGEYDNWLGQMLTLSVGQGQPFECMTDDISPCRFKKSD